MTIVGLAALSVAELLASQPDTVVVARGSFEERLACAERIAGPYGFSYVPADGGTTYIRSHPQNVLAIVVPKEHGEIRYYADGEWKIGAEQMIEGLSDCATS